MARARIASSIRHFSNGTEGSLTSGAVHIRVFPRPRNLAESREILKALEKYGEISMYKHLKVREHLSWRCTDCVQES